MSTKSKNDSRRPVVKKANNSSRATASDSKLSTDLKKVVKDAKSKNDSSRSLSQTKKEIKEKTEPATFSGGIAKQTKKTDVSKSKPIISKTRTKSEDKLDTPSSKRITKSQFFPTKNNYAELIQHLDKYKEKPEKVTPRKTTQTKTKKISPKIEKPALQKSVRQVKEEIPIEIIQKPERPRTSTLKKGIIVNDNIVGPEVQIQKQTAEPKFQLNDKIENTKDSEEDEAEYEDDFESYESDFENVSSSDSTVNNLSEISTEGTSSSSSSSSSTSNIHNQQSTHPSSAENNVEKKLDSGNFDLMKKQESTKIQDLIDQDNFKQNKTSEYNFRSNLTSLSDEGFEESKSLQFMNFVGAKQKHERKKGLELRKKRGEELLNMIKLDCVSFTVFEAAPVPYEEYIKSFGNVNSIQTGVQTGEENVDDAIQTDEILLSAKWIQMPPHISINKLNHYKYDRVGVGPDLDESIKNEENKMPSFNESKFELFVSSSGRLMLNLLKENSSLMERCKVSDSIKSLSDGFIEFKPPTENLERKKITCVAFNMKNPSLFLSVHIDKMNEKCSKSVVYVWNINDVLPEVQLVCYGIVSSCCFGFDGDTIFAGLQNGTLIVWETLEPMTAIKNLLTNENENDDLLRRPTFLTDIDNSHSNSVVAIQSILESNNSDVFNSKVEPTKQVCSLGAEGDIIVWTIVTNYQLELRENVKTAQWGKITLYKNYRILLKHMLPHVEDLLCTDMIIPSDPRTAFIGTNYGSIIQCTLNKERSNVKVHMSETISTVGCLNLCPFSKIYFLAGFENGNINLYSEKSPTALMVITNRAEESMNESIHEIQWSTEKPCIFYTRTTDQIVNVWDLSKSNIFPIDSVNFKEHITCMKLSPTCGTKHNQVFMMIATETTIYLHHLSSEHRKINSEEYQEEMTTFLNYVSRL